MVDAGEVKLTIPSLSEYVGVARLAASGIANRLKFSLEDIEDIKIAVSEACTNAVQYAYPETLGEILIKFNVDPSKLEIVIQDHGKGFDTSKKPEENTFEDDSKVGLGLGITFMKSLMDEVDYDSKIGQGTVVKLTKYAYGTASGSDI